MESRNSQHKIDPLSQVNQLLSKIDWRRNTRIKMDEVESLRKQRNISKGEVTKLINKVKAAT